MLQYYLICWVDGGDTHLSPTYKGVQNEAACERLRHAIEDTLPKGINIRIMVSVHEKFQMSPQIIIQGFEIGRLW